MIVLVAQETRCWKHRTFLPSNSAIMDSSKQGVFWWPNPKTAWAGAEDRRGKEACGTAGSKLRAICSLFLASRAFFHSWCSLSVCFHMYLEKLAYFHPNSLSVIAAQLWRYCFSGILGVEMTIIAQRVLWITARHIVCWVQAILKNIP